MRSALILIASLLLVIGPPASAGITRHDVLVIANSNSAKSQAVASYYAAKRGIPASHVRQVACSRGDAMTPAEFEAFRDQVKAHLLSLGALPGQPEADPIKAIVLTFEIPHRLTDAGERYSAVDSSLAAIFSESGWGEEPTGVYGRFQPAPGAPNPYYGDYAQPITFGEFRKDVAASTQVEVFPTPGFTLVRFLDADTALAAGGEGILFRGVRSGDAWTWEPIRGRNKGSIGWQVSSVSVRDATHAYACTGNASKPHGGGTIIATSDAGLTWQVLRKSPQVALFKLRDALVGVDFADPTHGWAVGSSQLYKQAATPLMIRTTNGGSTWSDISANLPPAFFPRAVSAADATNVWICGNGGAIYRSVDGGDTWTLANAGAPAADYTSIWVRYSDGAYRGWAAGTGGTIVRSEDGVNWTAEASGMATDDISDLAVFDNDHACAAYGGEAFLRFCRPDGWLTESTGLAPVVSAAAASGPEQVAVGATRYIFAKSPSGWRASYTGQDTLWRLRYLVTRLDAFATDVDPADGIPDDVKAMIDRGAAATQPGVFVIDEPANIEGGTDYDFTNVYTALQPLVDPSLIVYDKTSAFLTRQNNVIGYTSWGRHDTDADSYTSWGRPFHNWANGGVATVFDSANGETIDLPRYAWGYSRGGTIYPGKLSVSKFPSTSFYDNYRVVLHAANGAELASGYLSGGTVQIDLSTVTWPDDHQTYMQVYWPSDDPQFPGELFEHSRYPYTGASADIYDNRVAGIALTPGIGRTLMSETIHEGASGGTANVNEPWTNYCGQPQHLLPRYAEGYTWAEAAYMGLPGMGWQAIVFGDPLMAPFATSPTVTITSPAEDGAVVSGTMTISAEASATDAPGISRIEFWLDDDTLIASDGTPPFGAAVDTLALDLAGGQHTLEAIAFESGAVQNTGAASRVFVVNNSHTVCARVVDAATLPDGTDVTLEEKVVSAAFSGRFYIQDLDGARGIRVSADSPAAEGTVVTVRGTLRTVDGEREIQATSVFGPPG